MTPAEFKATRESLHLPVSWLADRWGVRRHSVDRWEDGSRSIPEDLGRDLEALEAQAAMLVEDGVRAAAPVLHVPRMSGTCEDGMPASWHRMIAKRTAGSTGARITYGDDRDE